MEDTKLSVEPVPLEVKRSWIEQAQKVLKALHENTDALRGIGLTYNEDKQLMKIEFHFVPTQEIQEFKYP